MAINPSLLIVPYRYKAAKLYSQLPESGAGDFVVTRGTTANRVNASGLIESVASGVPRLDYTGGGCPSLLVEPAATNLLLRSEEFDNAYWSKQGTTASGNVGVAPDGATTADLIYPSSSGSDTRIQRAISVVSGTTYTVSVFVKASGLNWIRILEPQSFILGTWFDLSNGTIGTIQSGMTADIKDFGNGWYRCSITRAVTSTTTGQIYIQLVNGNGSSSVTANGTNGILFWGAQLETGSVATSYIPTEASTVTRNADVISLSSVSGLIGQSAGTVYAELKATNFSDGARIFTISNGTVNNSISLQKQSSNRLRAVVTTASGTVADISTASGQVAGTYKIALAYAANDFVLYVNGTQIGTDTSGAVPATSKVNFGSGATDGNQANDGISAAAIYTSRLSNSELQSLTQL
jgi:hypothetical protein